MVFPRGSPGVVCRADWRAWPPRCWKAQERCTAERPELVERAGGGHLSACHFPEAAVPGSSS